jgi:hypothetical protein
LSAASSAFAGINKEDSGVFASVSGGVVASTSSGQWTSAFGQQTYDYSAPTTNGGTGSLRVGYLFAFGEKDKWNEFYFSAAGRYNILGNVINNISGIGSSYTYSQTSISQFGVEVAIGKYWKSPFYTNIFINPGFASSGSFFTSIGIQAGFDITERLSIFLEGATGGQIDTASTVFDFLFWQVGASGTTYTTGQLGLQYRF